MKKIILLVAIIGLNISVSAQDTHPVASAASVSFEWCYKVSEDAGIIEITSAPSSEHPYNFVYNYSGDIYQKSLTELGEQTVTFEKPDGCDLEVSLDLRLSAYKSPLGSVNDKAVFSVAADKQVYFSQGNLQFRASNGNKYSSDCADCLKHTCSDNSTKQGVWRFAEHQWDYVGNSTYGTVYEMINGVLTKCDNSSMSSSYQGWMDLFSYGTSGYNDKKPWVRNNALATSTALDETGGLKYDWGRYNEIICKRDETTNVVQPNTWRTLNLAEWLYLLGGTKNSVRVGKYTRGRIEYENEKMVNGVILIPDAGVTNLSFTLQMEQTNFTTNTLTISQWNELEEQGVVFLPAGGWHSYSQYNTPHCWQESGMGNTAYYWTASWSSTNNAYYIPVDANSTMTSQSNKNRFTGCNVRLVADIPTEE